MRAKSNFGLMMRMARQRAGLHQEELAHAIGCAPFLVEQVECNSKAIPDDFLITWSNAVRMQPIEIVLMYYNQQLRCTCLNTGLPMTFKLVPCEWGEYEQGISETQGPHARRGQELSYVSTRG